MARIGKRVKSSSPHKTKKRSFVRRLMHGIGILIAAFFVISILTVVLTRWIPIYRTPLMYIRMAQDSEHARPSHEWVSLEDISPNLVRAVMASEDNLFPKHNGFSKRGIQQAIKEKRETGHVRHGGSTISQQTAKNVFCWPDRSFVRKGFETYYTVLIELIWGKRRIMEVYLNSIEMGDGIYGAEAASQRYFHHSAKRLTKSESALIAVCLPNPLKMHPNHPSAYVYKRQAQILSLMPKLGKIDLDNPKKEK